MRVLIAFAFWLVGVSIGAQPCFAQGGNSVRQNDSLRLVRAAEAALYRADTSEHGPLVVSEFRRDSLGAVIALSPAPQKGRLILGGGARIRVFRNGTTKILEFFQ